MACAGSVLITFHWGPVFRWSCVDPILFFSMSKAMPRFPLIFPWMEKAVCRVFIRFARIRRMGFGPWAQRHRKQWKPSPGVEWPRTGEGVVTRRRSPMAVAVMVVKEAEALIWGLPEWYTGMKKLPISSVVRAVGTPPLVPGIRRRRRRHRLRGHGGFRAGCKRIHFGDRRFG